MVTVLVLTFVLLFLPGCSGTTKVSTTSQLSTLQTGLHVFVENSTNNLLEGAKVVSQTQPEGQLNVSGITSDKGIAVFNNIKPGNYQFLISRFDYEPVFANVVVIQGNIVAVTINLKLASTPSASSK